MIYLDSSVALAHLLAEDRLPPEELWQQELVSSRLLEYEVWNRIHARRLDRSHGDAVRALIGRVALLEKLERDTLPLADRERPNFALWIKRQPVNSCGFGQPLGNCGK